MKRTLRLLLTVGLSLVCVSLFAQKFPNYPIPQQPDTLRILGIGNSFTDDGMMYLPELLEAAGIRNVVLGRLYIAGCSLERHCREYAGNAPAYIYYKSTSNRWETVSKKATLLDGIADERWDVVVLQQASGKSGIYPTYQPWFGRLVEIVRWCCPNAGACIAWQQTWAYARNSQHRDFGRYEKNQQLMYRGIVSSVEQLMRETSVEVVVPSGTAIQDLRNTALCDSLDLTRDGYHLNPGTGRYTAACAWFQTLVAPAFGTNVAGNGCRLAGTPHELTPQEAEAILRDFCQQWEEHPRWGVWAVCTPDGQLAGHCGFLPLDGGPVELLYALAPAFWNQGLGTEAALAVLNYAAGQRLWPQVDALVYPQNRPSARILIKLGFVPLAQETHFGARLDRYRRPLAGL